MYPSPAATRRQESGLCTVPGQHSRSGPDGVGPSQEIVNVRAAELALTFIVCSTQRSGLYTSTQQENRAGSSGKDVSKPTLST